MKHVNYIFSATKKAILLVFITFSLPLNTSCQTADKPYVKNPYDFIAKELFKKQIVMLADNGHQMMLPYLSLISVLQNWKQNILAEELQNESLTLILERGENQIELIQNYIENGDFKNVHDEFWYYSSQEDLYLLYNLRVLSKELANKNIRLKITGFENNFTEEIFYTRSQREADAWFIKERDSVLAVKIRKYIQENPRDRILVFYGGLHLIDGYVKKEMATYIVKGDESKGFFLAHYLKDYFGKENVITFYQTTILLSAFEKTEFEEVKNESFLTDAKSKFFEKSDNIKNFNWLVCRPENMFEQHPIRLVFSQNILESCLKLWSNHERLNDQYGKRPLRADIQQSLAFITGKEFTNIDSAKNWISVHKENYFDRISTEQFSKQIFDMLNKYSKSPLARQLIIQLGFGPGMANTGYLPTEEEWNKTLWPTVVQHIKYLNAVGLYWIGTEKEKEKAKIFLMSTTSQDFGEPALYLEWWYKKYCNYSF